MEPADNWIDLNWAEARLTLRDENGKPYNYVAGRVPRPSPTPADWPTITRASATHGSTRR